MKNAQQATLIAIFVTTCGCAGSDYGIPLPRSDLVLDMPQRVNDRSTSPVEAALFTISSDGTLSATFDESSWTVFEGDVAGNVPAHTIKSSSKQPVVPVMFTKDNESIICAYANEATKKRGTDFGFIRVRLDTGARTQLDTVPGEWLAWTGKHSPSTQALWAENCDCSIILGDRAALTSSGTFVTYDRPLGFDMYGNGWAVRAGQTVMIDSDGHCSRGSQPAYLTPSQTGERGSMRIDTWSETEQHLDAKADVGIVWLADSRAVNRDNRKNRAAVAYSGTDIQRTEFLPHHQSIFVLTGRGTFIVPYHTDPVAGTPQS